MSVFDLSRPQLNFPRSWNRHHNRWGICPPFRPSTAIFDTIHPNWIGNSKLHARRREVYSIQQPPHKMEWDVRCEFASYTSDWSGFSGGQSVVTAAAVGDFARTGLQLRGGGRSVRRHAGIVPPAEFVLRTDSQFGQPVQRGIGADRKREARLAKVEIWITHTDGRQASLAEAMRLGADGLLSEDGLHRVALNATLEAAGSAGTRPMADTGPRAAAVDISDPTVGEPVLTAEELRALLQEQPSLPPSGGESDSR